MRVANRQGERPERRERGGLKCLERNLESSTAGANHLRGTGCKVSGSSVQVGINSSHSDSDESELGVVLAAARDTTKQVNGQDSSSTSGVASGEYGGTTEGLA